MKRTVHRARSKRVEDICKCGHGEERFTYMTVLNGVTTAKLTKARRCTEGVMAADNFTEVMKTQCGTTPCNDVIGKKKSWRERKDELRANEIRRKIIFVQELHRKKKERSYH